MKKRVIGLILLSILLCGLSGCSVLNSARRGRMLKAVHLDQTPSLRQIDYSSWQDPLKYKDGYEIMVFSVDKKWVLPDSWTQEPSAIELNELEKRFNIHLDFQGILSLSLGGADCSAWFFADGRGKEKPFGQREYYLGYLYDHDSSPLVFIYHGHHLYGIE